MSSAAGPLQGRVILDCSTLLPGPFLGKLLVEQGARVLKIENPDRPDPARDYGSGAYYEDLNSAKELVWLNLTTPEGKTRFAQLVREAHGLIEGFRPQAKLKLGLDERSLLATNPDLCIVSLVGYPEDGPMRDRAGHDLNFQALSGCLSLFREMPGLAFADLFSAYQGALAMASLLDAVSRGARGRRVVINMLDALKSAQSKLAAEFKRTGHAPDPGTTLISGRYPSYRIYSSADGRRIAVGALEEKFWHKVCDIVGAPELRPFGLSTGAEAERVAAVLQSKLGARSWLEWEPIFAQADCCVEPVLTYKEVF